jgi:hypothetical protein
MKNYKEYYKFGVNEHNTWLSEQDEEWWKKPTVFNKDNLTLEGDYIETIQPLDVNKKNDSSIFVNHTNIKNSEWCILTSMLGQALIDWCMENNENKLWSFNIKINKIIDNNDSLYDCSFGVRRYLDNSYECPRIEDDETLKKFQGCCDFLCDLVIEFIEKNGKDIPNDWNVFSFSLDDLMTSCEFGKWVAASDCYLGLGSDNDDTYNEFVVSM